MNMVIFETGAAKWVHSYSDVQQRIVWTSNRSQALVFTPEQAEQFVNTYCSAEYLKRTICVHAASKYSPYSGDHHE